MNDKGMLSAVVLMCCNTAVYDIETGAVLNKDLLPGAMRHETMDFMTWMQTRYSVGSNVSARRMMLRAFGSDNHNSSLDQTRALSLSDCYWLKRKGEYVKFEDVTPYLNEEWDGIGAFKGGSISTLFVNGAASKRWVNKDTLVKYKSVKMAYYYDFDWAWSGAVVPLPANAIAKYPNHIVELATKAIAVSEQFDIEYRDVIAKRASELITQIKDSLAPPQ